MRQVLDSTGLASSTNFNSSPVDFVPGLVHLAGSMDRRMDGQIDGYPAVILGYLPILPIYNVCKYLVT